MAYILLQFSNMLRAVASRSAAVIAMAILAFATPPLAAQTIANPNLYEKSLEAARQALGYYGSYDNWEELLRVNRIGYEVAQQSRFVDYPFSFYMVDMPVPNAFALPGGQIFITRGMLDLGLSDDMLAGLLGHEIAHVVFSHGIRMQNRAQLLNILSQVVVIGVAVAADSSVERAPPGSVIGDPRYGGSGAGDRIMGAAAAGMVVTELLLRSYSREFEDQADDEGQRMAAAAGYDPDGTRQLMALMNLRLPQTQEYGYWQTHPFFDQRVRAAEVRKDLLTIQEGKSADPFRQRTQTVLLGFREHKKLEPQAIDFLRYSAVLAWPIGPEAAEIRLDFLHRHRDAELEQAELARDFGKLIEDYTKEIDEVKLVEPDAPILATLAEEIDGFRRQCEEIYPKAIEVYRRGVFETHFLETFASNFPEAPEFPEIALDLGDAYSRLQRPADAVEQYLAAWTRAPESPAGQRARAGLKALASFLDRLDALQQLVDQEEDVELRELAEKRIEKVAASFKELANGAAYLKRYPGAALAPRVAERLNHLAENLYGEVILYQTVGDHAKALDGITRILTHAPLSPAAERLRERAVLEG